MPDQTFSEELYDDAALKDAVDRMANLIKTHATKAYVDGKVAEASGDSSEALSEAVSELKENLSESVSDLKSAITNTVICNPTTTAGKINGTGTIGQAGSNLEVYTSIINALPGQKFRFYAKYASNYTMWAFYATYDINGNFKERIEISTAKSGEIDETITLGENVYGIAFTYRTNGLDNSTIESYLESESIAERLKTVNDYPAMKDNVEKLEKDIYKNIEVNADDFMTGNVTMSSSGWNYNESYTKRVVTKKNTTIHLEKGIKIGLTDYSDYITQMEGDYIILIARAEGHETDLSSKSELLNLLFFENTNALIYKVDALDKGSASGILFLTGISKKKSFKDLEGQIRPGVHS